MLEQLAGLVQQLGQQDVVENAGVPNQYNSAVLTEAASSIFNGLQSSLANGQLTQLMGMANTNNLSAAGLANNPITNAISSSFIENIMNKFGISGNTAKMIAAAIIPLVLSKLFSNAKDPNNAGISMGGILDSLTGGAAQQPSSQGGFSDILSKLGGAAGLDRDGDGDVDLNDLIARSSNAAQQAQQKQGGSIFDALGGLLGGLK